MAVRGVEDIQAVSEQAALLKVAMLVTRDEPLESLFETVSREVGLLLAVEAGSVLRFIGRERAVIVGVYRAKGVRGLPVNAELDFQRTGQRAGKGAEHAAARPRDDLRRHARRAAGADEGGRPEGDRRRARAPP